MNIQKIERNKWIGIASMFLGVVVLVPASTTVEYLTGTFALVTGFILWWINK